MYRTQYREKCIDALREILPGKNPEVRDSTLLQAYTTYHLFRELPRGETCSRGFVTVYKGKRPYPNALLWELSSMKIPVANFLFPLRELFGVPEESFLKYVTPTMVANPTAFFDFFASRPSVELAEKVHTLINVKLTAYELAGQEERKRAGDPVGGTPETAVGPELPFEDAMDRLYQVYCGIETTPQIRLSRADFLTLYRAVHQYPLDPAELKLSSGSSKNVMELVHIFHEELGEPRARQLAIAVDFYLRDLQETELFRAYGVPLFPQNSDEKTRKKWLRKAVVLMAKTSPLDVLCGISLGKKRIVSSTASAEPLTLLRNDIPLENGLIYSLFTSSLAPGFTHEGETLIFFPSPFFVRKWMRDPDRSGESVTFVLADSAAADLLNYHYTEGSYGRKKERIFPL